jgi:hypothetical protein
LVSIIDTQSRIADSDSDTDTDSEKSVGQFYQRGRYCDELSLNGGSPDE